MPSQQARREVRTHTHEIPFPRSQVFPLLCPVREHDWLDGWSSELLYSKSGFAENGCIFRTHRPDEGPATWVVSRYDPDEYVIEFVKLVGDSVVTKLDIRLLPHGTRGTQAVWTYGLTALDPRGDTLLDGVTDEAFRERMEWVSRSLAHYCRTGSMLRRDTASR